MDSSLATNPNNPTTSTTAANFHLKVQSASLVSGAIANTQPAQGSSSKQFNKSQVSSRYAAASTLENRLKRGGPGADNRSDAASRRTH